MNRFGPTSDGGRRNRIVIGSASAVLAAIVGVVLLSDGGSTDEQPATFEEEEDALAGSTPDDDRSPCRRIAASAGATYLGGADLDGDGSSDRIVVGPTGEEIWIEPARARGAGSPAVVLPDAPRSVLDAVDLDGGGGDEVFVSIGDSGGGGPAVIVTYDAAACELRVVDVDGGAPLVLSTRAGAGVTCTTIDEEVEVVVATIGRGDDPSNQEDVRYRVRDGSAEPLPSSDADPVATDRLAAPGDRAVACSSALASEVLARSCAVASPIPIDDATVIGTADVDGDGRSDDVLGTRSRSVVWVRRADGTFSAAVPTPTGLFRFHHAADVDGDRDDEVVIEIGNDPIAGFRVHHAFDLDVDTCALRSLVPALD